MKKIPIRTCIGCNESKAKNELIRVVKETDGHISIDFTGKVNGRGAYICCNVDCLEKSIKTKRLSRTFEMPIDNEIYDELREKIKDKTMN